MPNVLPKIPRNLKIRNFRKDEMDRFSPADNLMRDQQHAYLQSQEVGVGTKWNPAPISTTEMSSRIPKDTLRPSAGLYQQVEYVSPENIGKDFGIPVVNANGLSMYSSQQQPILPGDLGEQGVLTEEYPQDFLELKSKRMGCSQSYVDNAIQKQVAATEDFSHGRGPSIVVI